MTLTDTPPRDTDFDWNEASCAREEAGSRLHVSAATEAAFALGAAWLWLFPLACLAAIALSLAQRDVGFALGMVIAFAVSGLLRTWLRIALPLDLGESGLVVGRRFPGTRIAWSAMKSAWKTPRTVTNSFGLLIMMPAPILGRVFFYVPNDVDGHVAAALKRRGILRSPNGRVDRNG